MRHTQHVTLHGLALTKPLTDIKGDNISLALHDKTVIKHYIDKQLDEPCPRKITPQGTFYASQSIDIPKTSGQIVLGDLGEAVNGDEPRHHNAQPDFFRAPEVMLKADWSYLAGI